MITIMHFPPGTSKWNKIETGCSATSPAPGVACADDPGRRRGRDRRDHHLCRTEATAVLDENEYPKGQEVSGQRMTYLDSSS